MTSVCGRTNIGYHELIGRKLFDHGTAKRTNLINNRCMDFSTDDNADTKISLEKKIYTQNGSNETKLIRISAAEVV